MFSLADFNEISNYFNATMAQLFNDLSHAIIQPYHAETRICLAKIVIPAIFFLFNALLSAADCDSSLIII